nr:hypothetical protein [Mycobacterium gordonae]
MPDHDEVDVVVIGMGPGGEAVGARLAQAARSLAGLDRIRSALM